MAVQGFSYTALSDAAIKGTARDTFIARSKTTLKRWKSCGIKEVKATGPYEEDIGFVDIGLPTRKEEFGQVSIDSMRQGYTRRFNMVAYAQACPISEEAIRYLKNNKISGKELLKPVTAAANSMDKYIEIKASDLFGNAFDTNFVGEDAVPLVSTAHVLGRGGTFSNHLGAVGFSQSSIEASLIQSGRFPDDLGLPIGIEPGKQKFIIPLEYQFDAREILNSTQRSDTANNAINALKEDNLTYQVNEWLPSSTNWFKVNESQDTLFGFFETKPALNEYADDKTGTMYFRVYANFTFDFGLNPRGVQGSNF